MASTLHRIGLAAAAAVAVSATALPVSPASAVAQSKTVSPAAAAIRPGSAALADNDKFVSIGFEKVRYPSSPNDKGLRATGLAKGLFSFYGRSLTLHYRVHSNAGKVRVNIDGEASVLDLYSPRRKSMSATFDRLKLKSHKVVITALNRKCAASDGTTAVLGYVKVER